MRPPTLCGHAMQKNSYNIAFPLNIYASIHGFHVS